MSIRLKTSNHEEIYKSLCEIFQVDRSELIEFVRKVIDDEITLKDWESEIPYQNYQFDTCDFYHCTFREKGEISSILEKDLLPTRDAIARDTFINRFAKRHGVDFTIVNDDLYVKVKGDVVDINNIPFKYKRDIVMADVLKRKLTTGDNAVNGFLIQQERLPEHPDIKWLGIPEVLSCALRALRYSDNFLYKDEWIRETELLIVTAVCSINDVIVETIPYDSSSDLKMKTMIEMCLKYLVFVEEVKQDGVSDNVWGENLVLRWPEGEALPSDNIVNAKRYNM